MIDEDLNRNEIQIIANAYFFHAHKRWLTLLAQNTEIETLIVDLIIIEDNINIDNYEILILLLYVLLFQIEQQIKIAIQIAAINRNVSIIQIDQDRLDNNEFHSNTDLQDVVMMICEDKYKIELNFRMLVI